MAEKQLNNYPQLNLEPLVADAEQGRDEGQILGHDALWLLRKHSAEKSSQPLVVLDLLYQAALLNVITAKNTGQLNFDYLDLSRFCNSHERMVLVQCLKEQLPPVVVAYSMIYYLDKVEDLPTYRDEYAAFIEKHFKGYDLEQYRNLRWNFRQLK